ncbi:MAG: hypothetical protein V4506_01270 [Bacteroidota bacterium]
MEISIKEPCHEKWEDMTPNEQGAFCGKCVKSVIDFSTKSLEEIKDFFSDNQRQKVCGRFEEQQLTALSFDTFFEKFKRFEFSKRFALILFFTFGFWLFNTSTVSAQSTPTINPAIQTYTISQQLPMLTGAVSAIQPIDPSIKAIPVTPIYVPVVKKGKAVTPVKPVPVKPLKQIKTGEVIAAPPKKKK